MRTKGFAIIPAATVLVHKAEAPCQMKNFIWKTFRDKGKFYQIDEDEHGTYIMNAKDLCSIEYLKQNEGCGSLFFKVEGRENQSFMLPMISKIYRRAIDDMEGRPLIQAYGWTS